MPSSAPIDLARAVPIFMSEIEAMGGAERSSLALGRWLHRHGRPCYLLTYFDKVGLKQHADFPLPTIELRPTGGMGSKLGALRRYWMDLPVNTPPPITSGYQPALHASLAPIRRFHCLMHDTPALFSPPAERSAKQKLRLAASNWLIGRGISRGNGCMIVTSEFLQADCRRDFGVHAEIARMGGLGDPAAFRRRPLDGTLRMLSVCRIEANKRIDWILDALAELEQATPRLSSRVNWSLTLAGKGALLDTMRARVDALGLADRIHLRGFVPDADLETLYNDAHLFLMPAVQGYGIPAIEALQRGIPVLLHRDSGVSDILLDTPWASVLHGGKDEMRPQLAALINWLLANAQMTAPPPPSLPTEDSWAERVATLCGYV